MGGREGVFFLLAAVPPRAAVGCGDAFCTTSTSGAGATGWVINGLSSVSGTRGALAVEKRLADGAVGVDFISTFADGPGCTCE